MILRRHTSRRNFVLRRNLIHPRRHVKLRHYSGKQDNETTGHLAQDYNSSHVVSRENALEKLTN